MEMKLEKALRHHRQNAFHHDPAEADRHVRALRRLKRSKTFDKMAKRNAETEYHRASERLLRMYA